MTENQLKYLTLQETIRNNDAMKSLKRNELVEQMRANRAKENLSERQLDANIDIAEANLKEEQRANVARETETNRSNMAKEAETHRSNVSNEIVGGIKAAASLLDIFVPG